jgi:hypothetical protein
MNYSIFFEAGFIGAKNYIKKMKINALRIKPNFKLCPDKRMENGYMEFPKI